MKVLVLGAEGMLGHKMVMVLGPRFPGLRFSIRGSLREVRYAGIRPLHDPRAVENVDALDWPGLEAVLEAEAPDFIVNCIGIVKQSDGIKDPVRSIALNALLPHRLAAAAQRWGGRLIHFSTDCVFSGRRGAYTEEDAPDAEDLYGRSKCLGEATAANTLTLRTSFIGRELFHRRALLEWLLAQKGATIHGYTNVLYSGITTSRLARLVGDLMEHGPALSGLYHVSGPMVSKHQLLVFLRDAFHLDVEIVPDGSHRADKSLSDNRFRAMTGIARPAWQEMADELAADPTPYAQWEV